MVSVIRSGVALVVVLGLAGCGDGADPSPMSGPSAPTPTVPSSAQIALSVTRGTTSGGTTVQVTGTGLQQVQP